MNKNGYHEAEYIDLECYYTCLYLLLYNVGTKCLQFFRSHLMPTNVRNLVMMIVTAISSLLFSLIAFRNMILQSAVFRMVGAYSDNHLVAYTLDSIVIVIML